MQWKLIGSSPEEVAEFLLLNLQRNEKQFLNKNVIASKNVGKRIN
jgi:hypothetical protein